MTLQFGDQPIPAPIRRTRWHSTGDNGQPLVVIVEVCDGLVQMTDDLLAALLRRAHRTTIPAGRSATLRGYVFLHETDLNRLLHDCGMVRQP